jgi:DNA-binding PadR family transcriptional regulator
MERNDLVRSRIGEPRGGRGGKGIKLYRVTEDGLAALAETRKVHDALWRGIPSSRLKEAVHEK